MKTRIAYLFLGIIGLIGLASCESILEDAPDIKTRTVYFSTGEKEAETRTGITIDDKVVTPDWRNTKAANVHLFETGANGGVSTGEDVEISISSDYQTASFKADFPAEWTIIVNPGDESGDDGNLKGGNTKAGGNGPYTYSAVVAQQSGSSFVVPAIQYPDAQTLIDPDADFLIGYSKQSYTEDHDWTEDVVDLYFDRPVSLSRISISNFEAGEKVKSVTIKAQSGLTGSAAYNAIDFENASVNFTPGTESGTIELSYGNGADIESDGTFQAYFVSLPGTVTITELSVSTDKYDYVKTIAGGKEFVFSNQSFKTIRLDLSTATKEEAAPSVNVYYKVTSTSDLEVGAQYLLVFEGLAGDTDDGDPKVFKPILGSDGTTFSKVTSNALDVEIENGTISSNEYEGSHLTLEAGYYLKADAVGMYLYPTSSSSGGGSLSAESTPANALTIGFDDGIVQIKTTSGSYYLVWSTSSHYFSSNTSLSGQYSTGICLYKLDDGRQPQTLSFSPAANAEYDLGTSTWTVAVPTLNGAQTPVTYALSEDSNPSVATVDADGTVHPKARGTVTVVATAAANAQYREASASYTLKVIDSSVAINTYYKVTSASDLETGAQYLLVYEGGSKVFKPILESSSSTTFSKTTDNALSAEIESGTISSNEFENCHITLESGYYLKVDAAGKYLYPDVASSRGVLSAESTASHALNITIGSNGIASIITKSGTYYLVWSTSSNYFSSNTDVEGSYSTGICLYKLDDGRQPQSPSFNPSEVDYDMAGSAALVKPTLSNAFGTVTYSSSNEEIASVDAESGDVTVNGRGTVKITATAAGNSQYKPGSASYTLNISNSNVQTIRFVLANSIEAGNNYLVVSGGQALKNNGGNVASEAVTASAGVIEIEVGQETNLLWAATAESGFTSNGHFSLSNGGYRMNRVSNSGNFSLSLVASTTAMDKYGVWDLQTYNGNTYLFHDSSSTMRLWVYYDGGWKVTYVQNSTDPTSTEKPTLLYVEDDGRQAQSLRFSASTATYDLSAPSSFVKPTLSTAYGTVTYSSSDATIAEVDNSGNITGKKKGTVTITATATGNSQYKPGSASYTLTITNSSVTTTKYYRASSIEAGKEYLVVSSGMALTNNNGIASTSVTVTNDEIELDDADAMLWTAEAKGSGFTLSNGGSFIQRASSNGTPSVGSAPSDNYYIWAYDNANQYLYTASGTKYYLYYSSSSSRWSQSSTASTSHTVTLYTSDPGSSSGGGDDPTPAATTYYPASSIVAGQQYLIVSNGKALQNGGGSAAAIDVTVNSGVIELDAPASALWTAEADGEAFDLINNGQYLRRSSSGSTAGVGTKSSTADNNQWYYDADNQRLTVKHTSSSSGSTTTYYLRYNTSWEVSTTTGNAALYTANPN